MTHLNARCPEHAKDESGVPKHHSANWNPKPFPSIIPGYLTTRQIFPGLIVLRVKYFPGYWSRIDPDIDIWSRTTQWCKNWRLSWRGGGGTLDRRCWFYLYSIKVLNHHGAALPPQHEPHRGPVMVDVRNSYGSATVPVPWLRWLRWPGQWSRWLTDWPGDKGSNGGSSPLLFTLTYLLRSRAFRYLKSGRENRICSFNPKQLKTTRQCLRGRVNPTMPPGNQWYLWIFFLHTDEIKMSTAAAKKEVFHL